MAWRYRPDEIATIDATRGIEMSTAKGAFNPSPRMWNTGNTPVVNTADGNNSTPGATTELYVAELIVGFTTLVTGIAVFAGSVWSDNLKAGLYDVNGNLLRATADTAGSGTADTYQRIAFATDGLGAAATTIKLLGPASYFIGVCFNGTTSRFNTLQVGNCGAGKLTGLVYATNFAAAGTALVIVPPTTFTTALGPIASLY